MNSSIYKVFKVSVFVLIIVISDQVIGLILRKLYFNPKNTEHLSLDYGLKKCKADIIIFGASSAQHHYDSRLLRDSLNMTCYNAGIDGGHSILMQYAQMKIITNRYSPKIIILESSKTNIVRYLRDYDRLSILLPYYEDFPDLRPIVLLRSPYEKIKLLSSIYPFNSTIVNTLRNLCSNKYQKKDFDGYIPIKHKGLDIKLLEPLPEKGVQPKIDTNMVKALNGIIKLCKEKNITLYIISSPVFRTINEKPAKPSIVSKLFLETIRLNNVTYFDFSDDFHFIGNSKLFKDRRHLNETGANIFTNLVINKIKETKTQSYFQN